MQSASQDFPGTSKMLEAVVSTAKIGILPMCIKLGSMPDRPIISLDRSFFMSV